MIYSVNFYDMTEKLNPLVVCKYLEDMGWKKFPFKRDDVSVYQFLKEQLYQVRIPMDRDMSDYRESMFSAINTVAEVENKSVERVMLYLLNPSTDILKLRLEKQEQVPGNITFDDAIRLYENAKKLIAATALDVINPKKIHYGRIDERVQQFLNQCRFGQTEIGSYVVSVVCPFAELSYEDGYRQLSIFSEEEECANSLTRKVTNKLMDNVAIIKSNVDQGNLEYLASSNCDISANFFEALNGLNLECSNTTLEFIAEWSPVVKINRSENSLIRVNSDYYQPIEHVVNCIREVTNEQTEIIGKIRQLKAAPSVDKREKGTIIVVYLNEDSKARSVSVTLSKEDYDEAVSAHKLGKTVKIVGNLELIRGKARIEDGIFSVYE